MYNYSYIITIQNQKNYTNFKIYLKSRAGTNTKNIVQLRVC